MKRTLFLSSALCIGLSATASAGEVSAPTGTTNSYSVGNTDIMTDGPTANYYNATETRDQNKLTAVPATAVDYTIIGNGRLGIGSTLDATKLGTLIIATGSTDSSTNITGGQLFLNGWSNDGLLNTLTNDVIIGASGYSESSYGGAIRMHEGAEISGSVTLVADAEIRVTGGSNSSISGAVSGAGKTLSITGEAARTLTFSGGVTLGTLNITTKATFSNSSATYSLGQLSGTAALTVDADVTLTLGSISTTGNLENNGTTTITGNVAHDITNTGMLTLSSVATSTITNTGTVKLSGDVTLGRTLTVSGGTVDLSSASSLSLSEGALSGLTRSANGYDNGQRLLISYSGDSWTAPSSGYSGTGTLSGKTISYINGKGLVVQVSETTQTSGTYYIVSDTSISAESNILTETTTDIGLGNGATLTLDSTWANQKTINSTGGTLSLDSGVTLERAKLAATGATVLSGSGVFQTSNEGTTLANLLGNNVSLSSWTGTVKLVGGSQTSGMKLSNLGSKIEFNGVSGWDTDNWKSTMSYNVTLADNGETAAWTNGAFSTGSDDTGTFSGTWSGTGTFLASFTSPDSSARYMNYKYTGNISAWTGTFKKDGGANTTTNLTFAGGATAINATITKIAGTLNVQADSTAARTFHAAITADKLTVGSFTDGATGTAQITLLGAVNVTTIDINAGTLSFGSGPGSVNTLTATDITVNSGGMFKFNHQKTDIGSTIHLNGGSLNLYDSNIAYDKNSYDLTQGNIQNADVIAFTKVDVQTASKLTANWKGNYTISNLTGAGNLTLTKNSQVETNHCILTLNLQDYTGTISEASDSSSNQWTLQLGGVSQAENTNATISAAVTLIEGFNKTGAGSLTFSSNFKLQANKAITVSEGSLIHDEVTYTALSGTTGATIARSEAGAFGLYGVGTETTVSNAKLSTTSNKAWGGNLENVSIENTKVGGKIWLTGEGTTKNLKDVSIQGTLYVGSDTGSTYGNGHNITANVSGNFSATGLEVGDNASITLAAQNLSLTTLNILGGTVTLGTAESHETNTLTVSNLTIGGNGAALNANLKLSDGAVVTLKGGASLTLGCTVQLADDTSFVVSAPLTETGTALIMTGVDDVLISSGGSVTECWTQIGDTDRWYTTLTLASGAGGAYTYTMGSGSQWLVYDTTSHSLMMMAPEPATTTLSLLALAGLCARRRRR